MARQDTGFATAIRRRGCARSRHASRSRPSESRSTPALRPASSTSLSVSARGRRSGRPAARSAAARSTIARSGRGSSGQPVEVEVGRDVLVGELVSSVVELAQELRGASDVRLGSGVDAPQGRHHIVADQVPAQARVGVRVVDPRGQPRRPAPLPRLGRREAQKRPGDVAGTGTHARQGADAGRACEPVDDGLGLVGQRVAGRHDPAGRVLAGGRIAGLAGPRLDVRHRRRGRPARRLLPARRRTRRRQGPLRPAGRARRAAPRPDIRGRAGSPRGTASRRRRRPGRPPARPVRAHRARRRIRLRAQRAANRRA